MIAGVIGPVGDTGGTGVQGATGLVHLGRFVFLLFINEITKRYLFPFIGAGTRGAHGAVAPPTKLLREQL